jgi:hypothetical protein
VSGPRLLRGLLLKLLYPLLMLLGGVSKHWKERLQAFVIRANNRLVLAEAPRVRRLLLLLPHCLQIQDCNIRITRNIYNCARCGRCEIRDLIEIAQEHNLKLFVATGGNLARRIVAETRPQAIVAVACENDLSSGIADTFPLPVLGIPNIRPFGPCVDTRVDLKELKAAIQSLVAN